MRISIRHRLLFVIVATVLTVITVHDIVAYRAVRSAAIAAAADRLKSVSAQLGGMLDAQARQASEHVGAVARDTAIVTFLRSDGKASEPAMAALRTLAGPGQVTTTAELWDSAGTTVLETRRLSTPLPAQARHEVLSALPGTRQSAVGPMMRAGDSIVTAAIARVAQANRTLGYVVQWRRVYGTKASRKQLVDLIGPGTEIYVGNTTGEVWHDFAAPVARPALTLPMTEPATYQHPTLGAQLAIGRPIAGTPWTLVLARPEAGFLAPVNAMVRQLALVTGLLLGFGLLAAWLLGTRLTTPLRDLAGAAASISAGDYSRRVVVSGSDEVGTLGRAFNQMATSVGAAHASLEQRSDELAERAGQLSEQATELESANEELAESMDEAIRTRDDLSAALSETARVTAELNASLASAPVGFAFHDLDGRYRRVNACLAALDGVSADAHVGRLPSEVVPGFGRAIDTYVAQTLELGSGAFNVELTDGTPRATDVRHWLASFYPIRTVEGELIGVGSVVTDLTAHKQLELQLVHSQKMEAVGRLAGGVAHDFNNILTAISGFGEFALAELGPEAAGARSDIEQVLAAANRAGALTRQLLAFSRQQVLQPRVLDLNEVVSGVSPMLARVIGEDVNLVSKVNGRLGTVKADPNQLEQVLVNLVVNARDAMPHGGTVVIETANIELDADYASAHDGVTPGPHVMLAVTDTGVGMDVATRSRAFEPFFTTKEPGKGTGLGLATVYGIVKQSGGTVEVYSELARGTTFKVYLPRAVDQRESRPTPPTNAVVVPNGIATVLLVDDDPFVASTGRRALERVGYTVLSAANGREAIEVAAGHADKLDLVITDLVMPEMGGRELARHLLATRPAVRVLYTSGYTAEAMNQQAVLEPGDAFLGKPFTPDALLRQVQAILAPSAGQTNGPRAQGVA